MKSESRQEKSLAVVIQNHPLGCDGDYFRPFLEGLAGLVMLHIDDHETIGGFLRVAVDIQMQRRQRLLKIQRQTVERWRIIS